MGFFGKARDMYNLQKQAKTLKKELKSIHIEAETDGITVTVTAEQEFVSVVVAEPTWTELKSSEFGKRKLEEAFLKAGNKAMKKAQEISSGKMKGIWNDLGVAQ
ncbi:YbaB/EbfC family nucleoid-associated protein [Candidatus Peregrinibacteria bacterium]|nr:YbaB/EbfC family nucleoid-associated protein [Candidatus Peregrinibacteria bacterium]